MADSSDESTLDEKEKNKFVKNMMNLANKVKASSEDEVYTKIEKEFRRNDIMEFVMYILTFVLAAILIYFYLK
ncbi:MAG: hypothetical protein ACTSRG_17020 [Candidatus Helarchaeota archaeon]